MEFIMKSKWYLLIVSIVTIVTGLCLIIWPALSVQLMCYIIGAALMLFGLVKCISFFVKTMRQMPEFKYDLAIGIFLLFCGLLFVLQPGSIVTIVQTLVGLAILADTAFKVQITVDAYLLRAQNWWVLAIFCGVTALAGLLLVFDPFGTNVALMIMIGVTLLVDGMQNIGTLIYVKRFMKIKTEPETVYYRPSKKD